MCSLCSRLCFRLLKPYITVLDYLILTLFGLLFSDLNLCPCGLYCWFLWHFSCFWIMLLSCLVHPASLITPLGLSWLLLFVVLYLWLVLINCILHLQSFSVLLNDTFGVICWAEENAGSQNPPSKPQSSHFPTPNFHFVSYSFIYVFLVKRSKPLDNNVHQNGILNGSGLNLRILLYTATLITVSLWSRCKRIILSHCMK